ncbi:MAG: hypothetical protein M0Z95_12740 [Actinomycetota bacterium]|jgi:hypothetical protein|nr:hypothetical protein [Actinomycetota bacterium]
MAREVEKRGGGGLKLADGALLVVVGVVGVLIAFWLMGTIAGLLWGLVKIVILLVVIGGVVSLLVGRRRRGA